MRTPIKPIHVLSDRAVARGATPSEKAPFAVLRAGAAPRKGLGASTVLFLLMIALVVLTMAIAGLVLLAPSSQWAILQG